MTTPFTAAVLAHLQARYLALVPRLRQHGKVYFRHVKSPEKKQDLLAEMVALGWRWFLRLAEQGRRAEDFPSAFATLLARAVNSGRKLAGMDRAKDVLSPRAQRTKGFAVGKLPDFSTLNGNPLEDALQDNRVSPVPEQVSFRCDFPAWRLTRSERDRRVIDDLMLGERTTDVAARHGLTAGRISQLRRDFMLDWHLFTADPLVV
jgi:hypothetical protein